MRRYILSTGRTGTVFLAHQLSDLGSIRAVHEPFPSRWLMMVANLRNDTGLGGAALRAWFNATRRDDPNDPEPKVELNPFLCALADLIPDENVETRVVHLVRHPADWAVSMTLFKASARYRHIIDYIPFAKPYPAPRPPGWHHLREIEKALWRWRWCNERLLNIAESVTAFRTLRSEDLFGPDPKRSNEARKALFDCLRLLGDLPPGFAAANSHRNARPQGDVQIPDGAVARICGPLAVRFGYDV